MQGTTFSGVAFAFATNTEAKEDIIVEWPGSGIQTKQKVRVIPFRVTHRNVLMARITDSHRPLLRPAPASGWMGS